LAENRLPKTEQRSKRIQWGKKTNKGTDERWQSNGIVQKLEMVPVIITSRCQPVAWSKVAHGV